MFAQARRNAEQPIEQRNHVGEAIVALSDEIRVAIHPLISHASPLYLQPGLRSRPTQPSAAAERHRCKQEALNSNSEFANLQRLGQSVVPQVQSDARIDALSIVHLAVSFC
jgi:hypothetical protein